MITHRPARQCASSGSWRVAAAVVDTLPIAIGVFVYGTVFGVEAMRSGLTSHETIFMSALVFAGASQFAVISMLSAGASMASMIITAAVVNLRMLLMGASMSRMLEGRTTKLRLAGLAAWLCDESYVLAVRHFSSYGPSPAYLFIANAMFYAVWFLSTALGTRIGSAVPDPGRYGLDFAFPAVFLAILVTQIRTRSDLAAAISAAIVGVTAYMLLPGNMHVLLSTFVAMCVGMGVERDEAR